MDSGNGVSTISEGLDGMRDTTKRDIMCMTVDGISSHSRSLPLIACQPKGESALHG
jgi:hypothetical protein